jgi:mRNA interferase RelE/StbE
MYTLVFAPSWKRDIKKIDRQFIPRINKKVFKLEEDPFPAGCEPIKAVPGLTRIWVGVYRVAYHVDTLTRTVEVIRVGHKDDETYKF